MSRADVSELVDALATVRSRGVTVDKSFALRLQRSGRKRRVRRNWLVGVSGVVVVGVLAAFLMRSSSQSGPEDAVSLARHIETTYQGSAEPLRADALSYLSDKLCHEHPAVVRAAARALYSSGAHLTVAQSLSILRNARASLWFPRYSHASVRSEDAVRAELNRDWARTLQHVLRGLWFRLAATKEPLPDTAMIEGFLQHPDEDVRYLSTQVLAHTTDYHPGPAIVAVLGEDTERIKAAAKPLLDQGGN